MGNDCIICGKPRKDTCLWCGAEPCVQAVLAMPLAEINAIREREAIEAFRQAPSNGRGFYFHATPRRES